MIELLDRSRVAGIEPFPSRIYGPLAVPDDVARCWVTPSGSDRVGEQDGPAGDVLDALWRWAVATWRGSEAWGMTPAKMRASVRADNRRNIAQNRDYRTPRRAPQVAEGWDL